MFNFKRAKQLLLILACGLVLTGCSDDDVINYPSNQNSTFVTVDGDSNGEITDNDYYYIYKKISSGSTTTSEMLTQLKNLFVAKYLPSGLDLTKEKLDSLVKEKYRKKMLEAVTGSSSYATDNKFSEYRYALSMLVSGYDIKVSSSSAIDASIAGVSLSSILNDSTQLATLMTYINPFVITPEMEWDDVFKVFDYTDYIDRYYVPDVLRQYLTAYYIYNQSYTAIGNTSARGVKIVKITDRTDKPGYAAKLVKAYIQDYILDTTKTVDLNDLARLWKGVETPTSFTGTEAEAQESGYITTDEHIWLNKYAVDTLTDKINEDVAKITGVNQYTTDATLESTYTGSYSYPVSHGVELAEDSLRAADYITDGTYLKSNGLESLPTTLRDRIFSTNYSNDPAAVEAGTTKDNSFVITHDDGTTYRFVTPEVTSTTGSDLEKKISKLYYYDATNGVYYITMIKMDKKTDTTLSYDPSYIVKTSTVAKDTTLADEVQTFRKTLAIDTAYEMASSDTYIKSAVTYFLTHNHIAYSDPDFYDYMLSNYPDAFDSDNKPLYEGE